MIRTALFFCALLGAVPLRAESVIALRTIRAGEVIGAAHVALDPSGVPGAMGAIDAVIGLEARRMIYQGRPVLASDIGPPAIVERNALVPLVYRRGSLLIRTEGRSLSRASVGERVRILNLASRQTVRGVVSADGTVIVDGSE